MTYRKDCLAALCWCIALLQEEEEEEEGEEPEVASPLVAALRVAVRKQRRAATAAGLIKLLELGLEGDGGEDAVLAMYLGLVDSTPGLVHAGATGCVLAASRAQAARLYQVCVLAGELPTGMSCSVYCVHRIV
jgi:hypothetical protein